MNNPLKDKKEFLEFVKTNNELENFLFTKGIEKLLIVYRTDRSGSHITKFDFENDGVRFEVESYDRYDDGDAINITIDELFMNDEEWKEHLQELKTKRENDIAEEKANEKKRLDNKDRAEYERLKEKFGN